MNITFLIGNGFDLGLGMKTSYRSFIKWYCKTKSSNDNIHKFKEDIKKDYDTWADLEIALGEYTNKFSIQQEKVFEDCYADIVNGLMLYLKRQERNFDLSQYSLGAFVDGIVDFYSELNKFSQIGFQKINAIMEDHKDEHINVKFVSFNYTDFLDKILEAIVYRYGIELKKVGIDYSLLVDKNVIHIHGMTSDSPILGVADSSQISNRELFSLPGNQFESILVKPTAVIAAGKISYAQVNEQISSSQIIGIFGMSIGATDRTCFNEICNWLYGDRNRHLIIYWYDKNAPTLSETAARFSYENRIRDAITSSVNLANNYKSTIRGRIHIITNTKHFLQWEKVNPVHDLEEFDKEMIVEK